MAPRAAKTAPSGPTPTQSARSGPSTVLISYLTLYNVLSAIGWTSVLLTTLFHLSTSSPPVPTYQTQTASSSISRWFSSIPLLKSKSPLASTSAFESYVSTHLPFLTPVLTRMYTLYPVVGLHTAIVQSFAVLEVAHVLLGWVRSGLGTTLVQVASRLILVWGIVERFDNTRTNPFYATMLLSWSSTEVIRYTFYALSLLSSPSSPVKVSTPDWLLYLRYTTFYLLYPTGASSEAFLIYSTLPMTNPIGASWLNKLIGGGWGLEDWVRGALFLVWWPGLYVMYTHMIQQRRKVLGGGRTLGKKSKTQ